MTVGGEPAMVTVWDPFVRYAHWTLAAAYALAYASEDLLTVHSWAGYVVAAIVVTRTAWGFVGPRYARFRDFVRPLRAVVGYLAALLTFRAPRYLGHSPAGGAMAVTLLAVLALASLSGMAALAVERGEGPLAPWLAGPAAGVAWADEAGEARREGGEALEALHETLADLSLILVVVHVAGVLLASLVHRENLVRAMIDGRKRTGNAVDE